jgi:hypothetical protein
MMPAYLMELLARYQGEELTRRAERAQIRSKQGDPLRRRSPRLTLRRRFKLRKTDPPVEIDLRDSGPVPGTSAQDWSSTLQANRANRQDQGLRRTRLRPSHRRIRSGWSARPERPNREDHARRVSSDL